MLLPYLITIALLISAKGGSSPGGAAKGKRNAFGVFTNDFGEYPKPSYLPHTLQLTH